jgi:hypothetical protein
MASIKIAITPPASFSNRMTFLPLRQTLNAPPSLNAPRLFRDRGAPYGERHAHLGASSPGFMLDTLSRRPARPISIQHRRKGQRASVTSPQGRRM